MDRDAFPLPRIPRQPSIPDLLEALLEVSAGFRGRRIVSRVAVRPRELDRVRARKGVFKTSYATRIGFLTSSIAATAPASRSQFISAASI